MAPGGRHSRGGAADRGAAETSSPPPPVLAAWRRPAMTISGFRMPDWGRTKSKHLQEVSGKYGMRPTDPQAMQNRVGGNFFARNK